LRQREQVLLRIETAKKGESEENGDEGALAATGLRGNTAIKSGVQKGENLLNSCRVCDVQREEDEGKEWHSKVKSLRSNRKVKNGEEEL